MTTPVLEAQGLQKRFGASKGWFGRGGNPGKAAVQRVSLSVNAGETLAIVGESGSGKSTTARMVMRLIEPDAGTVHWQGDIVSGLNNRALRPLRNRVQMVFQDPFASLNPRMTIENSIAEGLRVHQPKLTRTERRQRVAEMLGRCGLDAAMMARYPHQFSGGQRQRIGIARALIVQPAALVLDEPVSALDVSVQAQILNLLQELQLTQQLAYLFISHDLSVVRHVADRVLVMLQGEVVEQGTVEAIFTNPQHPYTRRLLAAKPISHPAEREEIVAE
ncbi:MAG: ATP-binding cassette domain-containing protein [Mariprofundales bacterium]|nr:ATP-binding cassette domain-containing protein [Mariprofundales bacterium]